MVKFSENTRKNLYYALDETIFYCEQLKLQIDESNDETMYEFLSDAFNTCLTACRVLNFARRSLRLFNKI